MPYKARPRPTRWQAPRPPLPRSPPARLARRAPATRAATPPWGRAQPTHGVGPPHSHIVARGRRGIAVLQPGRWFNRQQARIHRRGAEIAEQEFTRFARCLDVRPREAPRSLLLGACPRALDPRDLCATVVNPCLPAGVPAEPEREI